MKIAYLGAGTWGCALASLLAANGHHVRLWTGNAQLFHSSAKKGQHPKLTKFHLHPSIKVTTSLEEALDGAEAIIESVTSSGIRPVFERIHSLIKINCPIVITSKGIEQNSQLLLPEVLIDIFGDYSRNSIGCLSGPSHAEEVIKQLPTSVVSAAYDKSVMELIQDLFTSPFFRVYPNPDINGVAFGGAVKNIIAIACGISDGLGFGDNTKAALMTRGLHEIRKLSITKGCKPETLNGLAGMGDLFVTCLSKLSRNTSFGRLIAEGLDSEAAKIKIGMVVEGAYTCVSALQLGQIHHISTPITHAIYSILYEDLDPKDAVKSLLQRAIKEEHL